jgi:hypothetical protein
MDVAIFWDITLCNPYMIQNFRETRVHIWTALLYISEDDNIRLNILLENLSIPWNTAKLLASQIGFFPTSIYKYVSDFGD